MGNNKTAIFKGVLENAGLGEFAFYLKKAKTNLGYAVYALDNTDFSEVTTKSKKIEQKIQLLRQTIVEIDEEIEGLGLEIAEAVEESERGE